jgi:hypothetical protein
VKAFFSAMSGACCWIGVDSSNVSGAVGVAVTVCVAVPVLVAVPAGVGVRVAVLVMVPVAVLVAVPVAVAGRRPRRGVGRGRRARHRRGAGAGCRAGARRSWQRLAVLGGDLLKDGGHVRQGRGDEDVVSVDILGRGVALVVGSAGFMAVRVVRLGRRRRRRPPASAAISA